MKILVNKEERELKAIGKNRIEWTGDLLGNHDALHFDEENEVYTMSDDEFEWWDEIVEKLNKVNDLETELSDEKFAEYEEENFDSADLETEVNARLEWLESVA